MNLFDIFESNEQELDEDLRKWFKDKWVRFGPDGEIRGDCARGDDSEGKPKCLPQSKAQSLGKKGRASAAARKRREDPNPERSGKAINVNTKKKSNEGVAEGNDDHIWGPQGNFAGDKHVDVGGVTMKIIQVGDMVKYLGQTAEVVALSKDRQRARIAIQKGMGSITKDVNTSDLKQFGQGVAEAINPDITNPEFSHQQQIGDYLYVARYWSKGLKITAYDGNKKIGYAELMYQSAPFDDFADPKTTPKRVWLESEWTKVDPKYQRQGIMSTMYAYAKMLGNSVKPSQTRSDDAKAAWKSWRDAGDAQHLTREGVVEAFGPLPREKQQIRLGRHTVDIERVGLDKDYISFAWHDSQGQDHYQEVPVGDLGSYDDLIDRIKQEISYQERQYTDQGVAEGLVGDVVVHNYTKIPIDLEPGQAQIAGWGPNDEPLYRVKGQDGKEVKTWSKRRMLTIAKEQGVAEGSNDTIYPNAEVIKSKNGRPVGEIYQDGNSWGCFHYRADRGYDMIDTREDAIEALKDLHQETGRSRPDYTIKGVAEEQLDEECWDTHKQVGMKKKGNRMVPNCVPKESIEEMAGKTNPDAVRRIQQLLNKKFDANLDIDGILGPLTLKSIKKFLPKSSEKQAPNPEKTTAVQGKQVKEEKCPHCGGEMVSEELINEKKDSCYYKVKSRYKVWPSAYASGALVKCRKKGAKNWGNKSEGVAEGSGQLKGAGQALQSLKNLALMKSALTFQQLRQAGRESMITDAINACMQFEQSYLQNKQQGNAIFVRALRDEIDNFSKGYPINSSMPEDNAPELGDLLQGKLGKLNFQQGVAEGLNEMDKTQTPPGRDGDIDWTKKQIHLGPEHTIKAKDVAKHALKILNKTMKKSHADTPKKKGVAEDQLDEKWSQKYKDSINCSNPKGFSQKAHCAGEKKNEDMAEGKEYYTVTGTDSVSLRRDFNMSKDRNGWYLKEGATPKQKLEVFRAFGSPKLKEFNLAAFSGGTQTKGEDNVISPVGSQTRAQYKK